MEMMQVIYSFLCGLVPNDPRTGGLGTTAVDNIMSLALDSVQANHDEAFASSQDGVDESPTKVSTPLSPMTAPLLYTGRLRQKARYVVKDPTHPGHHLFSSLLFGKRFRSTRSTTTRLKKPFLPSDSQIHNPTALTIVT